MRSGLRLAAATLAGATLIAGIGAGAAVAETASLPDTGPPGTGSSMLDYAGLGSSMGSSALRDGDILGVLTLLVTVPLPILFSGLCDVTSMSGTAAEGGICSMI